MSFKNLFGRETLLTVAVLFLCISVVSLWFYGDLTRYIHPRYKLFTATLVSIGSLLLLTHLFTIKKQTSSIPISTFLTFLFCALVLILPVQTLSSRAALNREQSNFSVDEVTSSSYDDFSQDYSNLTISEWSSLLSKQPPLEQIQDKTAVIEGFALYDSDSVSIARFRISCCAVDATPVSIQISDGASSELRANEWYRVSGSFIIENGEYLLVPADIVLIEEPDNPYVF